MPRRTFRQVPHLPRQRIACPQQQQKRPSLSSVVSGPSREIQPRRKGALLTREDGRARRASGKSVVERRGRDRERGEIMGHRKQERAHRNDQERWEQVGFRVALGANHHSRENMCHNMVSVATMPATIPLQSNTSDKVMYSARGKKAFRRQPVMLGRGAYRTRCVQRRPSPNADQQQKGPRSCKRAIQPCGKGERECTVARGKRGG